ncbi:alpha/beta hydrolase [Streptomyces sp. NPDC047081]|uniref:alpha/beta hydrolase n=1 Tax=Streptomyces sp. NPDC047081 TaxID=3154706 RepID=UPI0033E84B45
MASETGLTAPVSRPAGDLAGVAGIASLGRALGPDVVAATERLLKLHQHHVHSEAARVDRDRVYGPHERHRMDVFTGTDTTGPVLLFVHGGGFVGGDKHAAGKWYYDNIGHWAARSGMTGVTLNYRIAPHDQWPAGALDVAAAVEQLKREGVAPGRIVLMGHSSGATHVASYLAGHANRPPTAAAAVLVSGIYDLSVGVPNAAYFGDDPGEHLKRSPKASLAESGVPLLLAIAEYDPPFLEEHFLRLLEARLTAGNGMPHIARILGHNHYSIAWHLGGSDKRFASAIEEFIRNSLSGREEEAGDVPK